MTVILQTQAGAEQAVSDGLLSTPADGANVACDLTTGARVFSWTCTQTVSVTISTAQKAGQVVTIVITNDGGSGHVVTFSTGFRATGTLTGTTSKTATVTFRSDGTQFWEISRATAIT